MSSPSSLRLRVVLRGATPFQGFFDALSSTIHRDTITTPLVEAVAKPLRDSLESFPFDVPQQHRAFLSECGITISDFGTKAHPHPVHKTIEINLLFNVWRHYASGPSSVMFMKPSKFEKLQSKQAFFQTLCNYRLTPRDSVRYPVTSSVLPSTESVFMHDALMYFSPSQILDFFLRAPEMQKLFCSLVVPPESDFTDLSFNPSLYRFQFIGPKVKYYLENNPAHSYEQPRDALNWLKTSAIIGSGLQLSVTVLDSWGPVHSLLIQRGLPPCVDLLDSISFKIPQCVLLP